MTTTPEQPGPQPEPQQAPVRTERRTGRRWADIGIASVLAAVLASGGTYAVTQGADGSGTTDAAATSQVIGADATSSTEGAAQGSPTSLPTSQDWAAVAAEVSPSVVSIEAASQMGESAGSGVVWDAEGHIVTNAHVVEGAQALRVVFADGRGYEATVAGTDPSSDLAVLSLSDPPEDLSPIRVGSDKDLRVGDPVMAIGNPLGLSGTVTTGIVSALDRPVTTRAAGGGQMQPGAAQQVVTNAVQTSAAINPGNSGGALVDASGALVGINSSIASLSSGQSQSGSIGIGFAIPATEVQLIADQLIENGSAEHAYLGVYLDDGSADVDGATLTGALVRQVEQGTPASEAGLQEGDLVVSIDGEHVPSAIALVGQVRERGAGQPAELEIVRDGQRQQVTVTFATRPDDE